MVGSHGEKDGSNDEREAVVDFRKNPADKSKTGGWLAAGLILGAYDELVVDNIDANSLFGSLLI